MPTATRVRTTQPRREPLEWHAQAFAVVLRPRKVGEASRFLLSDGRVLTRPTYEGARDLGQAWASFYESLFEVVSVELSCFEQVATAYGAVAAEGATA